MSSTNSSLHSNDGIQLGFLPEASAKKPKTKAEVVRTVQARVCCCVRARRPSGLVLLLMGQSNHGSLHCQLRVLILSPSRVREETHQNNRNSGLSPNHCP